MDWVDLMLHKYKGTIARMWHSNPPDYFVDSLSRLLVRMGPEWNYERPKASWHEGARNELSCDLFLGDWLLMLDTDHCFAPDILDRLLFLAKKYDFKVLSGIYQYKAPPHLPVAGFFPDKEGLAFQLPLELLLGWKKEGKEVAQVGMVGGGCLLIHKTVINRIKQHYKVPPFTLVPGLSEDYSFCWRCKELEIPVGLAINVECHHSVPTMLSIDDLLVSG